MICKYVSMIWMVSIVCLTLICGCGTPIVEPVPMPPKDLDKDLESIEVKPFSSDHEEYGHNIAEVIKNKLAKDTSIKVLSNGAKSTLTGSLTIGNVTKNSYYTQSEVTEKDSKGRKYKKNVYTHYFKKSLTGTMTYSVSQGGHQIGGSTYSEQYENEWRGQNAAEARAKAESDDSIVQLIITRLANKVVSGVSTHKENWGFLLQDGSIMGMGGNKYLKVGVKYYKQGLYSQAEGYWKRVINGTYEDKDKAAAYYNLGVLMIRNGQYEEAWGNFREADRLEPGNKYYMEALQKVEEAEKGKRKIQKLSR